MQEAFEKLHPYCFRAKIYKWDSMHTAEVINSLAANRILVFQPDGKHRPIF